MRNNLMMTDKEFSKAISKFDELEKRGSFYDMAVEFMNNSFEIEAHCLFLATWNFAAFRYAVKDFDVTGFKETIGELNPYFDKMKNEDFRTIDFEKYKEDIKKIFETLSEIKGVQYTGASKVMHLRNRSVFVMWDDYISGNKPKRYYSELEIVKREYWRVRRYRKGAEEYFQFLKDTQELFKSVDFRNAKKTFAKAIDEYNYVNITLPIQKMEKENQEKKKRDHQRKVLGDF